MMQITLFEAVNLRNVDPMGQQDPYVKLSLGKHYHKRSKCIQNGGTRPYFEEEEMLLWLDQENWVEDLKLQVLDEDAKENKPIGATTFSLLPYMKYRPEEAKEDSFDLFYAEGVNRKDEMDTKETACGEIFIRVRR